MKRLWLLLALPWLVGGCAATFTNLTPLQQPRNANNLYPVEVAFHSRQQSLRWDSIKPQVVVGSEFYPMRQVPLVKNRWEALLPVSRSTNLVHYQYKFDFLYNAPGQPRANSATSPVYTLRILD